ncbi:e9imm peptide [Streptomyces sp. NPDC001436]
MTREEAVALVTRLMDGSITDESEANAALATLTSCLRCPHLSDYIYWDFDPDLSADKIVGRAMAYKPFAL